MKTILDDPDGFLEQGGWDFLSDEQPGSDQEGASDDDSEGFETPEESEFEVQHVDLHPTTRSFYLPGSSLCADKMLGSKLFRVPELWPISLPPRK